MATITAAQQTEIFKIVTGLFNAAPGAAYLTTFTGLVEGGTTMQQLSQVLAATDVFTGTIMAGRVTSAAQVQQLMTNFGLTYVAVPVAGTAAGDAQNWFDAQLTAGRGFGDIVYDAVTALSDAAWVAANPVYASVATALANKAAVAQYYSVTLGTSSTSLTQLQAVLAPVTATTPVATPTDLAAVVAVATSAGTTFTLTTSAPIITEIMVGGAITKAMTFTLTLGSVPAGEVTVDYATQTSGTAASGTDFVAATGTVTFVAGQTVANVSVVVNDDALAEGDETVAVQFSGASLAAPVTGTGTILKNDTAGLTVVLTAGTETPVLGPDDDTINSTQAVPVQLNAVDIVAGGDGTDILTITPTIDTAFTLDDAIFTQVSGIDKIVIADTGTGGQTITTAGLFQAAFGAAGVDLQTTATTAATGAGMVVNLSAVTGPVTLTTTTTTGAQVITTGNGNATVFATASTGAVGITTGTGADVVTLTTSDDTGGVGCVINTGAGNDIITIVAAGGAATSIGNLITGGLGADTITLGNDAEINTIVIGNTDSGITLAGADSITGFVAATDTLKMGTAAAATGASTTDNYVEAGAAVADFAAALSAANIQLAALALATTGALEAYAFQWVAGTNGYLFNDTDGSGTADQVVVLVGIIDTTISNVDIIA